MPFGLLALVPWRWWLYGALVAVAVGVVVYYHHQWYTQGFNASTQVIEDANKRSESAADAAQQTVDQCFASGGLWDRGTGVCLRGKPAGQ